MKAKLSILLYIIQGFYCQISAQAYYMHEAAEDSDNNPLGGILGILIIIGIGLFIHHFFGSKNKQNNRRDYNEFNDDFQINYDNEDSLDRYTYDSQINNDIAANTSEHIQKNISHDKDEDSLFRENIIRIYGNQTERFGGILIIKEDGEYHYLLRGDKRYEILDNYLLTHKPNNCTDTKLSIDWDLIHFYQMVHPNDLHPFNPIECANIEINDFLGGKLLALKSYYITLPFYSSHPIPRLEFFISIGFEETILLHKIIKQPMSPSDWYDFKIMQIKNFKTYTEYKRYRQSAGIFYQDKDGWYDDFYGYLADTYAKARKKFNEKEGYTIKDAYEDIKTIKWEI